MELPSPAAVLTRFARTVQTWFAREPCPCAHYHWWQHLAQTAERSHNSAEALQWRPRG